MPTLKPSPNPEPTRPHPRTLPRRRTVLLLSILPLCCLLPAFCVGPPGYYAAKYAPAGRATPLPYPKTIIPDQQTEPHTCGLHSLSSLYRAYGLDPESLRLRFRIGVDKPFTNFISDSTGTIHPDMLRVLHQDGFATDLIHPGADTAQRLAAHLDSGHMAIALIRVSELHWVILAGREGDNLIICDSLRDELYTEPLEPYVNDRLYSLILISPSRLAKHNEAINAPN